MAPSLAEGLLSYGSSKRYLILPVDVLYICRPPLPGLLCKDLGCSPGEGLYELKIRELNITKRKGTFFPAWVLDAEILINEKRGDTLQPLGSLLYHTNYPVIRKEKQTDACRRAVQDFRVELFTDLMNIDSAFPDSRTSLLPSWYPGENIRSSHLNISAGIAAGWNFKQAEAELWFSYAQKEEKYTYTSGLIRYQETPDFESIALGRQIEHLHFRINSKWAWDSYYAPLLGFNKWKNFETEDPGLLQILQLSFSSAQTMMFSSDNSSLIWKGGLFVNGIYIPEMNPVFQIGLCTSIGFRY
ncbi:MAG: hypothetical protein U0T82_17430 [Bacteroidales bacterium]